MPDFIDPSQYDLPAGAILNVFVFGGSSGARSQLLAQLNDRIEEYRKDQKEWTSRFDSLYEEARKGGRTEAFLILWAAALLEKQRAALELFHPVIEELQRIAEDYAARPDLELRELCLETIELVLGWITPYQKLCGQLLELGKRRASAEKIRYARPAEGEIDHNKLTHEIIARFPNILAKLAK